MPDTLPRTRWQAINTTPLRELLRGRVTAWLDWRALLVAAAFPAEVNSLITNIVHRTRLWRMEKSAVADELIAHFTDGITAGTSPEQLIHDFGDERTAAKLIRRAKRRGRPLVWHLWTWAWRGFVIIVPVYALSLLIFFTARPGSQTNFLAKLNAPALATPVADRAWPLWRRALLACGSQDAHGNISWPAVFAPPRGNEDWPAVKAWLHQQAQVLELARQAAAKPTMGFILGFDSKLDRELPDANYVPGTIPLETDVMLPHLHLLQLMAIILTDDARDAAEAGDPNRAKSDVVALIRLAKQLRGPNSLMTSDLVALEIDKQAVDRLDHILFQHPKLLSDQSLIDLAHLLAGPQVASDLLKLRGERWMYADMVQLMYSGNPKQGGRITWQGIHQISTLFGLLSKPDIALRNILGAMPFIVASRSQVMRESNNWMNKSAANLAVPLRNANWKATLAWREHFDNKPLESIRYVSLLPFILYLNPAQESCARYLGQRDGTLVAIALEFYHRQHGHYPATLAELTPQLLPAVPADRITGKPLHYRLKDGKPVVYSVGADRTDDGGTPPMSHGQPKSDWAAQWDLPAASVPHGDWVLYPSMTPDEP